MRVFVNEGALDVPPGSDVSAAIRAFDPNIEGQIASGLACVTDGRGIELAANAPLASGAILRVIIRARRGVDVNADA